MAETAAEPQQHRMTVEEQASATAAQTNLDPNIDDDINRPALD
jgi:hypothetical protein